MVIGFGVFFLAYIYTCIQIFLSIAKSKAGYEDDITNDK